MARDPVFGVDVVTAVPNVPSEVLLPRATWPDPAAYDAAARKLAGLFRDNFRAYEAGVSAEARGGAGRLALRGSLAL